MQPSPLFSFRHVMHQWLAIFSCCLWLHNHCSARHAAFQFIMEHTGTVGCASFVHPTPCAVVSGGYFLSCSLDEWIDWFPLLGVAEPCWCKQTVAIRVWINRSGTAPRSAPPWSALRQPQTASYLRLKTPSIAMAKLIIATLLSLLLALASAQGRLGMLCWTYRAHFAEMKQTDEVVAWTQQPWETNWRPFYIFLFSFFLFLFCQAHHCGAFIQKHSSIVTIFLSLMHSHVFVWFFVTCTSCTMPLPLGLCAQLSFLSFVAVEHFGAWADFQMSWTMEGRH